MSHSLWCCSPNRMTARELWELNEEGLCDGILDEERSAGPQVGHPVAQGIDGTTCFDLFDKRTAHNISLVDESSPPALPTKVIWLRFLESSTISPCGQ